jgi:hypothetical protein
MNRHTACAIKLLQRFCGERKTWLPAGMVLFAMFGFASRASAGTFYIDFATGSDTNAGTSKAAPWKHAPGMAVCSGNCSSHAVAAGDTFIFKGSVAWDQTCYPWVMGWSGSTGNPITFTVDQTWFAGASWTQPTFDANHTQPDLGNGMLEAIAQSFLTFNNLNFINVATAQVSNSAKAVNFQDTHDIAFTNDTFAPECWINLYFTWQSSGTFSNVIVDHSDISHTAWGIAWATWFGSSPGNAQVDSLTASNNNFHDFTTQIGGGVHGDCIHMFNTPDSDGTQYFTNTKIFNNRWYGSFARSYGSSGGMTSFVRMTDGMDTPYVYNNIFSYSDSPSILLMQAPITLASNGNSHGRNAHILNNSFYGTPNGMSAAVDASTYSGLTMENNIFSGMGYAVYLEDTGSQTGFSADYNDYGGLGNAIIQIAAGTSCNSADIACMRGLGYETHGAVLNPGWANAPNDLHLTVSSLLAVDGANLSSVFTTDRDGNPRPGGGAWSMGAYQGTETLPAAPTNLAITLIQ